MPRIKYCLRKFSISLLDSFQNWEVCHTKRDWKCYNYGLWKQDATGQIWSNWNIPLQTITFRLTMLLIKVPGLFVPKTFRSQERIVPGTGNESSPELSFPGPFVFVPGERKFLGTFVPWTFRSEERSFRGLFVPKNFRASDYFTRHWLWTQTAIATVRICFVVGLVVFLFQK